MIQDGIRNISTRIKTESIVMNADVVRTKKLEVVDGKGQIRALLDVIDGESVFCLTNNAGLRTVEVRAGDSGAAQISLIRDGESTRFVLALTKTNRVVLSMLDTLGNSVYSIGVDQVGKLSKRQK